MAFTRKQLGHGVGLRNRHYGQLLEERPAVAVMEAISENYLTRGGRPRAVLEKVRRDVPVILHGVSLSIGGVDPLSERYLDELAALVRDLDPAYVSDHLCWGSHGGRYVHDLLPLPYTEEALGHVVERVQRVQERLGRQICLENVSSYVEMKESTMPEWTFLSEIARRADCGILLDVNNIYVSSVNHGFDPLSYVDAIPVDRVGYFHLAGHTDKGRYLLDTHDHSVPDSVWTLYRHAVRRFGRVTSIVEWDDAIPPLEELLAESAKAVSIEQETLRGVAA